MKAQWPWGGIDPTLPERYERLGQHRLVAIEIEIPENTLKSHVIGDARLRSVVDEAMARHKLNRARGEVVTLEPPDGGPGEAFAGDLYSLLRKSRYSSGVTIEELADEMDVSPKKIRSSLRDLEEEGKHVHRAGDVVSAYVMPGIESTVKVDVEPKERVFIGVVSDTHFGSMHQQPTLLNAFMMRASEKFDLSCWIHCGDATDGGSVYRGHVHEIWISGADDQADYFAEVYPKTGLDTYIISGNHDYNHIQKAGADVIARISQQRDDIHPLGHRGAYVDVGGVSVYAWHPTGGASYAKSYKLQKRVEGFSDNNKPHILLSGHLHQYVHVWHRNVHAFLVPSFQATSVFIRSLGYESMIGAMVLEIALDDFGEPIEITPHLTKYDPIETDYPRWSSGIPA